MFWADKISNEIKEIFAKRIKEGETLVIRDEKTLSGRPHVGSLRSASLHGFLAEDLKSAGVSVSYLYEINDTDALDALPPYVSADFSQHLGKRLVDCPSPSGEYANYAEEFAGPYIQVLKSIGFELEFYRGSARYAAGEYDEAIRQALEQKDLIRQIYKAVSGSEKGEDWYPLQVICDECGKIATTVVKSFDGEKVAYECRKDAVKYTQGCGHTGYKSPFGGAGTLPWKVEWAAKWQATNTDIEGAGKDHYAAGGSRLVANRIAKEVFGIQHPFDIRHEFILIGGAKMSSSSGAGATAEAVAAMLPRHIFRYFLLHKDVMKTLNFTPDGDTLPLLFDGYDTAARQYYDAPEKFPDLARIFELTHGHEKKLPPKLALPKFSQLVFLCQMPHLDIEQQVAEIKGSELSAAEKQELALRIKYAQKWLASLAPEQYRFELGDYSAEYELDDVEKKILADIVDFLTQNPKATGHDIHTHLHALKEELKVEPKKLFQVFYRVLLHRESGPQLGFMLAALPHEETVQTLKKAVDSN